MRVGLTPTAVFHYGPDRTLVTANGSSHDVPKGSPDLALKEIEGMVAAQR